MPLMPNPEGAPAQPQARKPLVMAGEIVVQQSNVGVEVPEGAPEGMKVLVISAPDESLTIFVPLPPHVVQTTGRELLDLDPKIEIATQMPKGPLG